MNAEFTGNSENDSENEISTVEAEMLEGAITLTAFGHAMTDYLLNNDDAFSAFCVFIEINGDENVARVREMLPLLHDTFADMCDRARKELVMSQIMTMFGSPASQS